MSTIQVINAKHPSSASNNIVLDASGNATFAGTAAMSSSFLRNRIINGGMQVWQRGTSFSVTAGTTAYTADRFSVISIGGTTTASQVAGTGGFQNALRLTGGSGVTNCFFGQKIESVNAFDLAGGNVTFQIRASASTNRTLLWYARYPNTTDNYAAVTLITSGSINITTTPTIYTFTFAVPGAATTGLEVYFETGAFTSGTIDVTGVQLEVGTAATPFERRQFGQELALCQRYYRTLYTTLQWQAPGASVLSQGYTWPEMRSAPTIALTATVGLRSNVNGSFPAANFINSSSARVEMLSVGAGDSYDISRLWTLSAEL